jgi:hypothetical protein
MVMGSLSLDEEEIESIPMMDDLNEEIPMQGNSSVTSGC